jgi:hypothetical protein
MPMDGRSMEQAKKLPVHVVEPQCAQGMRMFAPCQKR